MTDYKGIDVYKLTAWTQGPALLQSLNILENFDLKAMGYNSARYIHTLYQAMNLAFADRDFYYGDPYVPAGGTGEGPAVEGIRQGTGEADRLDAQRSEREAGRSVPVPGRNEPVQRPARQVGERRPTDAVRQRARTRASFRRGFTAGTTSIQAADEEGLGGLGDAERRLDSGCIAGRTGIGMSQRMQSFVLDRAREPVQRPRARQAPARDADAEPRVEGRQAVPLVRGAGRRHPGPEPPAVLPQRRRVRHDGAGGHRGREPQQLPDAQLVRRAQDRARADDAQRVDARLGAAGTAAMGYRLDYQRRTSGPINAVFFDRRNGSMWGGSSNHGEDYGIAW